MAQTLVSLLVRVIFCARNRVNEITPEIEPELFAYMGGILRNNQSRLLVCLSNPYVTKSSCYENN